MATTSKIRHSRAASLLRSLAGSAIALKSEVDGAPVKTDGKIISSECQQRTNGIPARV